MFFPALTGIMAGVNMSGDLKNPSKSIPKGILYTILAGFVLYALEILICGGAFKREVLINEPYKVLVNSAPWNSGFLLTIGVAAATLSTGLGLFVCAPRVLQALANDHIIPCLAVFGKGRGAHHEPFAATVLLGGIVLGIIAAASWKGLSPSGMSAGMNQVAEIASMCFLLTYTMVNLAAFVESYGKNPSFRPRFKFFHWSVALYGFLACLAVSFYINFWSAGIALLVVWGLFIVIKRRKFQAAFGDARRGFLYSRIRENLLALARLPYDPKNWRPTISILSGKPEEQLYMPYFASILEADRGIVSLVKFVEYGPGESAQGLSEHQEEVRKLYDLLWTQNGLYNVFPEAVVCSDYDRSLQVFLQAHLIGPLKPNIVMMNYPENPMRVEQNIRHLHTIQALNMSALMMMNFGGYTVNPDRMIRGTIDVWWRGTPNLSVMLILANILRSDPLWLGTELRILRVTRKEEDISS